MLHIEKTISISGHVTVEVPNGAGNGPEGEPIIDDIIVVRLTATIPSATGVADISRLMERSDLYEQHKAAVRAGIREFEDHVYDLEDAEHEA